jgi:hypothetical protein
MWCSLVFTTLILAQVLTHLITFRHDPTVCTSLVASAKGWSNNVGNAMLAEAQSEASKSAYVASFGLLYNTRGGGCYIYLYDVKYVLGVLTGVWCVWKYKTSQSIEEAEEAEHVDDVDDVDNGPPQYILKTPTVTPDTTPTSSPKKIHTQLRQRLSTNGYENELV